MSSTASFRPEIAEAKRTFHIVASRFNAQYVDGLVDHATQELRALAPDATISLHRVPGAFEIPVVVRELADPTSHMGGWAEFRATSAEVMSTATAPSTS